MTDATKLPPEVAEAMDEIAGEAVCSCSGEYTSRGIKDPACNHDLADSISIIRAELLRLTEENGQQSSYIEALTQRCVEDTDALGKAEAERNALRARIESSPVVVARDVTGNPDVDVVVSHALAGKRVRLVLESETDGIVK
jgi:hypothetical protein